METEESDDLADDDDVTDHRARATTMLDQIARQTKQALVEAGIDTPVFLIVPTSGSAIVTFGTIADPPDDQWSRVSDVVASVVRDLIGLDRVQCREVQCATTQDQECCDAAR